MERLVPEMTYYVSSLKTRQNTVLKMSFVKLHRHGSQQKNFNFKDNNYSRRREWHEYSDHPRLCLSVCRTIKPAFQQSQMVSTVGFHCKISSRHPSEAVAEKKQDQLICSLSIDLTLLRICASSRDRLAI